MGEKYTAVVYRAGSVGLMGETYTAVLYRAGRVGLMGGKYTLLCIEQVQLGQWEENIQLLL